jgi:hypothetical protein
VWVRESLRGYCDGNYSNSNHRQMQGRGCAVGIEARVLVGHPPRDDVIGFLRLPATVRE